jgi:hypothetical protein
VPTRILSSTLVAAAAALACAGAHAAHRLNDTGIGFCIDADGNFIDCAGTGQDAESGRDVTHPRNGDGRAGFSFTRFCNSGERAGEGSCPARPTPGDGPREWGCTRDDVTGLLWENKTASGHRAGSRMYTFFSPEYDPDGKYGGPHDLTGFLDSVNAAGLCGAHDWRLPKPIELQGIVDMAAPDLSAVDARFFPNTAANFYWAAGVVRGTPLAKELAWGSDFAFGLGDITSQFRESPRPVRLVRGGGLAGKRYIISPDGQEVTDRLSALVWRRCAEGQAFDGARCAGTRLVVSWTETLANALEQAQETGVPWRLPNVKEQASLLDHEKLPHIDVQAFPGGNDDYVWTSSSFPTDPTPRCVDFPDGMTFACSQGANAFGSRLVRDRDPTR